MPFDASTTGLNIEALSQMKRVMREVEADGKRFNLSTFRREDECGTVACALGWAFLDPWFTDPKNYNGEPTPDFFGLSEKEWNRLFHKSPGHEMPSDVIAEIDRIIDRRMGLSEVLP